MAGKRRSKGFPRRGGMGEDSWIGGNVKPFLPITLWWEIIHLFAFCFHPARESGENFERPVEHGYAWRLDAGEFEPY